jgi:hypothetical protein
MSTKTYSRIGDGCDRYNVVPMTIHRWINDPRIAFPQPAIRAGNAAIRPFSWKRRVGRFWRARGYARGSVEEAQIEGGLSSGT